MARDGRLGVSMMASPIAEESVTAEEANELINKAKTIVEADMGVKVPGTSQHINAIECRHSV